MHILRVAKCLPCSFEIRFEFIIYIFSKQVEVLWLVRLMYNNEFFYMRMRCDPLCDLQFRCVLVRFEIISICEDDSDSLRICGFEIPFYVRGDCLFCSSACDLMCDMFWCVVWW